MTRILTVLSTAFVIGLLAAPREAAGQPTPAPQLVPLKIHFVLSRHAGGKKVSSVPYTIWVTANGKNVTQLRMGSEIPVPSTGTPPTTIRYRSVGTHIDCLASSVSGGLFDVNIKLDDNSVMYDSKESGAQPAGAPAFRTFQSHVSILLKDGQTAEYIAASDPVSGEVLRIDVTLNVLK